MFWSSLECPSTGHRSMLTLKKHTCMCTSLLIPITTSRRLFSFSFSLFLQCPLVAPSPRRVATSQSGPHHGCEGTHYYLPKRTGWRTMESHRPRARLTGPAVCSHMDSPLWRVMYAPVSYAEIKQTNPQQL